MMDDRLVIQASLFYHFRLDDHVPADQMLRAIDRFLDFDALRRHLAPFYSTTGRPSIDPELMIRMLLVGYCFGIRSEWRLCEEVHLNLAYRWFCRLDWTVTCRITPLSRRTVTTAFATAMRSGTYLRRWWAVVSRRSWSAARDLHGRQPDRGRCQQAEVCLQCKAPNDVAR